MLLKNIIQRELKLAFTKNSNLIYIILLFFIMLTLSLLSANDNKNIITPIIWLCSTFAIQLSVSCLFERDYHNGMLEQFLILNKNQFEFIVVSKIFSHWLSIGIPIAISTSIINLIFMENDLYNSLLIGFILAINSFIVLTISAVGHTLMLGKSNSGIIIAQVLIMPLLIPIVIYFQSLLQALSSNYLHSSLIYLGVMILCSLVVSIFTITAAIKLAIEQD